MKKYLFLFLLLSGFLQAQVPVYDPANYSVAMRQLVEQHNSSQIQSQGVEMQSYLSDQIADLRWMHDSVGVSNRQTSQFGDWHQVDIMLETIGELRIPISTTDRGHYSMQEILGAADEGQVQALYHLLTNPERPYGESASKAIKRNKLHLAISYFNLAEETLAKARLLYDEVMAEDHLTMTAGERVSAIQSVQNTLMQALELKRKSGDLYLQAIAPDKYEQIISDHTHLRKQIDDIVITFQHIFKWEKWNHTLAWASTTIPIASYNG